EPPPRLVAVEQLDVDIETALEGDVPPVRLELGIRLRQVEVAAAVDRELNPELGLEILERRQAAAGQLDPDPPGPLQADAAAGQRGRAGADAVALQHDDAPEAAAGQLVGGADSENSGPDDDRVSSIHTSPLLPSVPRERSTGRGDLTPDGRTSPNVI